MFPLPRVFPSFSLFSSFHRVFSSSARHERKVRVLLVKDTPRLGLKGETVEVRPGFARHWLVQNGSAVYNTQDNRRKFEISTGSLLPSEGPQPPQAQANNNQLTGDDSALISRKFLESEKKRLARLIIKFARPASLKDSSAVHRPVTKLLVYKKLTGPLLRPGLKMEDLNMADKIDTFGQFDASVKLSSSEIVNFKVLVVAAPSHRIGGAKNPSKKVLRKGMPKEIKEKLKAKVAL